MKLAFLSLISLATVFAARGQRIAPDVVGPITIQPIQHATLVLSTANVTIYSDPVGGAKMFTGLKSPDIILITDIHGDHMDAATLAAVRTPNTIIVMPQAVADKLPDSLKTKAMIMHNGDKGAQMGIGIEAIPMYNLPGPSANMHTKGRGNGYVLTIGGKRVYISGDTQGIPEMRDLKKIDIAFVCMNLPYTMDVKEAADAVLAFKPVIVYPFHYRGQGGLSDVEEFKKLVNAGDVAIEVRLRNWYAGM
jgi:L-ascorbate metabolism protein UlaG (beta-lactamase superfamily)